MPITQHYTYTCDRCGATETSPAVSMSLSAEPMPPRLPEGWTSVRYTVPRHEAIVCPAHVVRVKEHLRVPADVHTVAER
jgi:hypothetical protein